MKLKELLDYCKRHRKVFCYGAGKYGRLIRAFLHENGVDISAFIVTEIKESGQVLGVPVIPVSDYSPDKDCAIIIGVGKKNTEAIIRILESKIISDYHSISADTIKDIEQSLKFTGQYRLKNNICALYYHRVCNIQPDIWKLAIKPDLFEKHIKYLSENYKIIRSDSDFSNVMEPSIIITFDDGYADNFMNALPILERYNTPATVFVSTGNVDTVKEFWWDALERIICRNPNIPNNIQWHDNQYCTNNQENRIQTCYDIHPILKVMSHEVRERELRELAEEYCAELGEHTDNRCLTTEELKKMSESPLVTIGGHTVTHSSMNDQSPEDQNKEIVNSKKRIEEIIGKRIDVFSYPFGGISDYSIKTMELLKENDYIRSFTTNSGMCGVDTHLYEIPRNWVNNTMTVEELDSMIKRVQVLYG